MSSGQGRTKMFELPEYVTLARQLSNAVAGKRIREGRLGNSPHKFVWYNRSPKEFASLAAGKRLGKAYSRGRWLFIPANPGYVLVFGECGGKLLYHLSEAQIPKKYHLAIVFEDSSALSAMTQMWGAMELYEKGEELKRKYICDMRPTPIKPEFSFDFFTRLIDECLQTEKRSVKGLLTQDQLIPGLGNAIAQDIMFEARLHPRHPIDALARSGRRQLYDAIQRIVSKAIREGGRNDEYDLFGHLGGYERTLSKDTAGKPCPECGTRIEKMQYLGGTCYYCPHCQV
jgi:formamidopyrimidine-DNA glycosylase